MIYIAGPMTGYKDFNYPAFNAEKIRLEELGYSVVSPADLGMEDKEYSWEDCIKASLRLLLECDGMSLLEGWNNSRGATLEKQVADATGVQVYLPGELK